MSKVLEDITRVMRKTYGRDFYPFEESFLQKTLEKRLFLASVNDFTAYSGSLSENNSESEALFGAITISLSEFFRNPLTLALTEQLVIPILVDEKEQSGRAGDELARSHLPDPILMDISLPVTDGFAALEEIRANETLCPIPVIALTASAMSGDREEILTPGFDGYLSTPIDAELFHQTIREALDGN